MVSITNATRSRSDSDRLLPLGRQSPASNSSSAMVPP